MILLYDTKDYDFEQHFTPYMVDNDSWLRLYL